MVVLSQLHHEKIQHMVLYVQCGFLLVSYTAIVLDTKRFGFALDRSMSVPSLSECYLLHILDNPMQIPGQKTSSRIWAFQLYHTLIPQHSHTVTPSGDAPRCGYCVLITRPLTDMEKLLCWAFITTLHELLPCCTFIFSAPPRCV